MNSDRDSLEDWLAAHPEAQAYLADLESLRALYQSHEPPPPRDAVWNAVQARVHHFAGGRRMLERSRWPRLGWSIVGLTAAAALLGLLLTRPSWWTTPTIVPPNVEDPLPVVEADDIRIVSMDARDLTALVVGEPPVPGELVFAQPQDIRVIRCERCPHSGRYARLEPGDEVPMFVTAAAPANDD